MQVTIKSYLVKNVHNNAENDVNLFQPIDLVYSNILCREFAVGFEIGFVFLPAKRRFFAVFFLFQ